MFPLCYWRFHPDVIAGAKIPQETVIPSAGQASSDLAGIVRAADIKRYETGALGSTEFIFEPEEHAKLPFVMKTMKAVLKSFDENDSKVSTSLTEFKLFGVFAPSKLKSLPAGNNLSEVFKAKHLKAVSKPVFLEPDVLPPRKDTRAIPKGGERTPVSKDKGQLKGNPSV